MSVKTIPAEEYVNQLLGDKDFITSSDIPLNNDFDYVMCPFAIIIYNSCTISYNSQLLFITERVDSSL